MPALEVLKGLPHRVFRVSGDRTVIGRDPKCTIWLRFDEVSREHAEIVSTGSSWYIRDCGSRNGTYLNDQLLEPGIRQRLHHDDCVQICDVFLKFRLEPVRDPKVAGDSRIVVLDDPPSDAGPSIISRLDMSSSSVERAAVNASIKLQALLDITRHLRRSLNLDDVLTRVLESLFALFPQAERGIVVLRDGGAEENYVCRAVLQRDKQSPVVVPMCRSIMTRVTKHREAILSDDALVDERFKTSDSIGSAKIRSVMCAPLLDRKGHVLGVLQLDAVGRPNSFTDEELDLLANAAVLVAFAVENSQLHEAVVELQVARKIQRSLLPKTTPHHDEYDFFDFYMPAKQVGGDFFDYIDLPDERLAVVLADVSGKGVGAALLVAKIAAELRVFLGICSEPVEAINRLNKSFVESGVEGRFVTMVLLVLDLKTHQLSVINAGHMRPLLRNAKAEVVELADAETGLPIGMDPDHEYRVFRTQFEIGESIVLYTDGVTDATNSEGEFYRAQRLQAGLMGKARTASKLGPAIIKDVRNFVSKSPRTDDLCLVCVSRPVKKEAAR